AEEVPLGFQSGGDVRLQEARLRAAREGEVDAHLVRVGDVVPYALVRVGRDLPHRIREKLQDPVEVVRAPVIDRAAGDGLVAVPEVAGVRVAAYERLHIKELPDGAGADDVPQHQVIRVPAPALENGQQAVAGGGLIDHPIDLVDMQCKWLLANDVLAGGQRREHRLGMGDRWGADHHQAYFCVVEQLSQSRVDGNAPLARRQLP